MLNVMRDNLRHLKPILWIVAISMVAYLGAYFSCDTSPAGPNAPWAARVDGNEISAGSFHQAAQRQDRFLRQTFGEQYDQLRAQFRVGQQSINFLVNRQIVLLEAEKLGIGASAAEIQQSILSDPSLQGPDGNFIGTEPYKRLVNRNWAGGVAAYERYVADQIRFDKWRFTVASPARVTDGELLEIYRGRSDRTEIDYVVVASASQDVDTEIADADARAWYGSHGESYRKAAGRRIRFATVSRQDRLAEEVVDDAAVAAYYDEHRSELERPEQRRVSHILIKLPRGASPEEESDARGRADAIHARILAGEALDVLARELSEDELSAQRGGDLEFFPRGAMVPEFEQAAFDTAVGQLAPVTRSAFGFHVIQVTDARAAGVTPLDEIREDLRLRLQRERADESAQALIDELRSSADTVAGLDSAAAAAGLEVQERIVRRGESIDGLDVPSGFIDELFDLEIGSLGQPTAVRQGWVVVAVAEQIPESIAPFEEVEQAVKSAVINERGRVAAEDAARLMFERHGSIETAAEALGVELLKSGSITPVQIVRKTGGMSPELRDALFGPESGIGGRGVALVPAGAVIYEITARDVFDPQQFEQQKTQLREEVLEQRRAEVVESALTQLRQSYEVEINNEIVNRVDA